jgi:hypothetical protein
MATLLGTNITGASGASGITFGDGTVQLTKTPANVSAFTNNATYVPGATAANIYARRNETVGSTYGYVTNTNGVLRTYWYDYHQVLIGQSVANCNCNC